MKNYVIPSKKNEKRSCDISRGNERFKRPEGSDGDCKRNCGTCDRYEN